MTSNKLSGGKGSLRDTELSASVRGGHRRWEGSRKEVDRPLAKACNLLQNSSQGSNSGGHL